MHVYLTLLITFQHAAEETSSMLHDMCMHMTTNLSWLTMAILVSVSPSGASAVIFFLGGMTPAARASQRYARGKPPSHAGA